MSKRSKVAVFTLLAVTGCWIYYGADLSASGERARVKLELPQDLSPESPQTATLLTDTLNLLPAPAASLPEPANSTDDITSWSEDLASLMSEDRSPNANYAAWKTKMLKRERPWFNARRGTLQQCEGQPEGFSDNTAAVLQVYSDYIPTGSSVHCSRKDRVAFENQEVTLVYIVYGELRGCDPHCYASQICAINDGRKSYLFSAHWYAYEEPINLVFECPDAAGEITDNTNLSCNPRPSGYSHPAVKGSRLASFYSSAESNVFRYCFM